MYFGLLILVQLLLCLLQVAFVLGNSPVLPIHGAHDAGTTLQFSYTVNYNKLCKNIYHSPRCVQFCLHSVYCLLDGVQ